MGGGGSLHANFALSMGVEVPGAAATGSSSCSSSSSGSSSSSSSSSGRHYTYPSLQPYVSQPATLRIPGKLISGFLLDRIGRRTTLLCGLLVGSCACLACALLSSSLALRCALVGLLITSAISPYICPISSPFDLWG